MKIAIKSNPFTFKPTQERSEQKSHLMTDRIKIAKENLIKGLLLALELESANAILKMGVFTSILTGTVTTSTFNMNNFIFFTGVLSVRIGINQTIRRFNV